jgi:hypothetical protein
MPQRRQYGPSLLSSTALLGIAAAGAALGAMPGLPVSPLGLVPLAVLGAAGWLHHRRDRRIAARLRDLRLSVTLPIPPTTMAGHVLDFRATGPGRWQAGREGWGVSIHHTSNGDLPWQLNVHHPGEDAQPIATAASMDAMLSVARSLLPAMAANPGQASLLDCDLSFPLHGLSQEGRDRLTALAEGGYALEVADGCLAVAAQQAELLLCRGGTVPATSL